MTRRAMQATAAMGGLATTGAAMAADAGANPELLATPETFVPAMIASILMFVTLFLVLKKTAWGKILQGLQDRELKIRSEIEAAENARIQAKASLDEYQRELARARSEANQMISQAKAEAQRVADELRARNEAELTSMKDRARQEIESAKRAALNEIYQQTASMATLIAGKILEREISAEDQARLVEQSLSQLREMGNGKAGAHHAGAAG